MSTDDGLTDEQLRVKDAFIEDMDYWSEAHADALKLDVEFFDHFRELAAQPYREGALDPKVKELVLVAINSSPTHLHDAGIRTHVANALDAGATFEEVNEVLQRTAGQGVHAIIDGVPILTDEMDFEDEVTPEEEAARARVRETFEGSRGYWHEFWEDVMALDRDYVAAYFELSSHPFDEGPLSLKVKEFVSIANDAATTHLYMKGLRAHVQHALEYGATPEEIMEVLELTSLLGLQTHLESAPILIEEARKRDALPAGWVADE